MSKKKNPHHGSRLDDFLKCEGVLDEFRGQAIKEVISWKIGQAMAEQKISKARMAELIQTSRAQLDRLLDPKRGNITIETLQRAAAVLGRELSIDLK